MVTISNCGDDLYVGLIDFRAFHTTDTNPHFWLVCKLFKMVVQEFFTARSLGQGNIFTSVCRSVHNGRGVSFPECITGHMTGEGLPLGEGLHPGMSTSSGVRADSSKKHGKLRDMVNKRVVRILLECILVFHDIYRTSIILTDDH